MKEKEKKQQMQMCETGQENKKKMRWKKKKIRKYEEKEKQQMQMCETGQANLQPRSIRGCSKKKKKKIKK